MEARGFELDKKRYKALFAEMCRREEAGRREGSRRQTTGMRSVLGCHKKTWSPEIVNK